MNIWKKKWNMYVCECVLCAHICVCIYIKYAKYGVCNNISNVSTWGWYSTYLTTSTSWVSVIKKDAHHEWLARLTNVYWWLASLPPRVPTCRKKQDASVCHEEWEQNNKRKENPLFCDTDSLFMDSYPIPEVACICPDVMGKVTAWNWDWGGEAGWAGTGRRTMIRLDQLWHTKHEKQPPTLNFRKKKCWAKGAHGALCSNGKSATGTNTAWRHTVQAGLWRLDQTLPTHKGMGGPRTGEMEQLQIEIWTGAFTSMLHCVPLKIQTLTDLFKDLLQYLENVNWSQRQDATTRMEHSHAPVLCKCVAAWAHFARHIREILPSLSCLGSTQKPSAGLSSFHSPRAKHVYPRLPGLPLYFIPQKTILKLTFIVLKRILLVSLRAVKENGILYERRRKPGSFFPF